MRPAGLVLSEDGAGEGREEESEGLVKVGEEGSVAGSEGGVPRVLC